MKNKKIFLSILGVVVVFLLVLVVHDVRAKGIRSSATEKLEQAKLSQNQEEQIDYASIIIDNAPWLNLKAMASKANIAAPGDLSSEECDALWNLYQAHRAAGRTAQARAVVRQALAGGCFD